ncbi:hypothetical protein SS50377_27759 [Spironucleus salmonicida]|uniref:Uncharacterized protein n=1 Tax=Spironucleus salmonicida TaxID=348837 RepID=V6LMD8_9EUKA|nr:hypothetical protein SS50377_27759 [Spironucleus salmonicida]|eukprot:EST44871.1 Hypothetical protein SS50377_15231 [Spironucleus salmonicida]
MTSSFPRDVSIRLPDKLFELINQPLINAPANAVFEELKGDVLGLLETVNSLIIDQISPNDEFSYQLILLTLKLIFHSISVDVPYSEIAIQLIRIFRKTQLLLGPELATSLEQQFYDQTRMNFD